MSDVSLTTQRDLL